MKTIISEFMSLFNYAYTGSVILATYILLRYVFKRTTDEQRILVTTGVGLILGIAWILCELVPKTEYDTIIYSFLFANVFYKFIIKGIMNHINVHYDKGGSK